MEELTEAIIHYNYLKNILHKHQKNLKELMIKKPTTTTITEKDIYQVRAKVESVSNGMARIHNIIYNGFKDKGINI